MSNTTNKSIKGKAILVFNYWFCVVELVVLVFIGSILAQRASALTMKNDNYILQMGNLNTAGGKSTGSGKTVGITVGQTAPGLYSKTGSNYKVRSGFQYIHLFTTFSFSIDNTLIDFGHLTATNPVTRTNKLTISNGSAPGYTITAQENHELLDSASGAVIPNTTCDNGLCTSKTSNTWNNILTYGFGYRCDNIKGIDCAKEFTDKNKYKQFSISPSTANIMSGSREKTTKESQITYKVNISGTQAAGSYTNMITFIATPTF